MSELVSIETLLGLAVWGFSCHRAGNARTRDLPAPTLEKSRTRISAPLVFLILAAVVSGCFGQAQTAPAPLKAGQQKSKSGFGKQNLNALRSLRFEPTVDGAGMVSRSERRSLRIDPGGSVEIQSLVSGKPAKVELRLEGSNSASAVTGAQALPSYSNYFLGKDPANWRTEVTHFGQVRVNAIYPGIDLLYYGNGDSLEHDYQLAPGADPARIRIKINSLPRIDPVSGDLIVSQAKPSTELLRLHKPVAYQAKSDGSRELVAAAYRQNSDASFSFILGDYDRARPLVIDPVITYSTYFGGSYDDAVNDVKLDAAGNIYLLVQTSSVDMPVMSQIAGACNGMCGTNNPGAASYYTSYDYFVAKLDPTGQTLLFSTYIGGSQNDTPGALGIGTDGKIYISGQTFSPDFPVVNEHSNKLAPLGYYGEQTSTSTLTALSADGSKILYSTFIGGGFAVELSNGGYYSYGYDGGYGIGPAPGSLAVGPDGIVYLLGYATTTTPGEGNGKPFYDAKNAGFLAGDGSFIAKFDTTRVGDDSLIYARPFGSSGDPVGEMFSGIALDSKQNLWVFGSLGQGGPLPTADAVQPVCGAGGASQCLNAFVFKMNPDGAITYATYLGGTTTPGGGVPTETSHMIYVDSADNVYLSGLTLSSDFPTLNAAYTNATVFSIGGGFLTKLSPGGQKILYSTYLPERNTIIAATPEGMAATVFVEGGGKPVINGLPQSPYLNVGDPYILLLDTTKAGSSSVASLGYLGSSGALADAVTFDAQQNLVLGGTAYGTLPLVDPFQSTCAGNCRRGISDDGFLSRIQYQAGKLTLTPTTASFPNTNVGSMSTPLTANLTNSTAQTITLTAETLTDLADFTATDDCNGSIASAASCTVTLTFKPSAAGALRSTYSIADASQPGSPLTVALTGIGVAVAPSATLTPALNLGSVIVGSVGTGALTFTNTGPGPITLVSSSLSGSGFVLGNRTCDNGAQVFPGSSCIFTINFTPTASGTVMGSLTVNDTAGTQVATLTGTGVAVVRTATLTPFSLDFGSISVGTSAPAAQFLILTNTGNAPLHLSKFQSSDPVSFTLDGTSSCFNPAPLAAAASCGFGVHFSATNAGKVTASFTVQDDAGTQVATLTGTGVAATLTPALNLGSVIVGSVGTGILTFTNASSGPITLTSNSLTGSGFALGNRTCDNGAQVFPGASCIFTINFTPSASGTVMGIFTVNDTAGTQVATLTGIGVAVVHTATLTPFSLGFGSISVGTSAPAAQFLILTNTGNAPLHLSKFQSSDPVSFTLDGTSSCFNPAPLAAAASCGFGVHFSATNAGKVTASFTVQDDAGTQVATLTGTGVAVILPDFTLVTTQSALAVFRGSTATLTLQLGSSASSSTFTSPVTFSASGLPAGATSTFAPTTVTVGTGGSKTDMTIFVPALNAIDRTPAPERRGTTFGISTAVLIVGLFSFRRKLKPRLFLCLCVFSLLGVVTGCGSGNGFTVPTSISNIVVTATGGAISHTISVTLTIK